MHMLGIRVDCYFTKRTKLFPSKEYTEREIGKYGERYTEKERELATVLFQIEGIESVTFWRREIGLTKDDRFPWDDLLPLIIVSILLVLAPKEKVEELPAVIIDREHLAEQFPYREYIQNIIEQYYREWK